MSEVKDSLDGSDLSMVNSWYTIEIPNFLSPTKLRER